MAGPLADPCATAMGAIPNRQNLPIRFGKKFPNNRDRKSFFHRVPGTRPAFSTPRKTSPKFGLYTSDLLFNFAPNSRNPRDWKPTNPKDMRSFIYLLVIAAAAYLGYTFYKDKMEVKTADDTETTFAESASGASRQQAAAAEKQFQSKIPLPASKVPGEKHLAKPGVFYVLQRASIEHASGIAAVVPGEEVRLLMRKDGGMLKVVSVAGKYEFEMKESQLTNDLDVAREVERKYALTHPPSR